MSEHDRALPQGTAIGNPDAPVARARVIAHYLPQFHPIVENDEWWGAGFTEWTNVAQARPLFRGHEQPKLPGELGFYDLRLAETREAQAALAARHGIEAFCYWHYWFAGRRLLERPFREVLDSGQSDVWSSVSDGRTSIGRRSGPVAAASSSSRPIPARTTTSATSENSFRRSETSATSASTVGRSSSCTGRTTCLMPSRFADQWRRLAEREGLPGLYLVGEAKNGWRAAAHGFDAEVHPRLYDVYPRAMVPGRLGPRLDRALRRRPKTYPYAALAGMEREPSRLPHPELPMVVSNWDSTPRFGRHGFVLTGSTPQLFEECTAPRNRQHRTVTARATHSFLEVLERVGGGQLRGT